MKLNLSLCQFKSALKRVTPACSDDEKRPVLNCVQVTGTPGTLRLESADGFRLHRVDLKDHPNQEHFKILLDPAQIAAILKTKIARYDDPIITLETENEELTGRILIDNKPIPGELFEGQYPDVQCLFPVGPALFVTVDRAELLQACKTARVFAREGSNVIQLHVSDSLIVIGKSEETGQSATVLTPRRLNRVRAHDMVLGCNATFLIEYLQQAEGLVTIALKTQVAPITLTDENGLTGLIMPVNIDKPALVQRDDIKPQSAYDCTGAYVCAPEYTRRNPAPDAWHYSEERPEWAQPRPAPELEPWENPITVTAFPDRDIFQPVEIVGALKYDIVTIWSYLSAGTKKNQDKKVIVFHFDTPRPDTLAPIPVEISEFTLRSQS